MQIDRALLARLWPRAPAPLVEAVAARSAQVLARYKINSALRVAHFLAQVSHESDGGTVTAENLNYRTAQRIAAVWPRRFTPQTAQAYVGQPEKLADKVYNGRMGNQPGTDDGWRFRGRGLLQLTGRASYAAIGEATGLDLEDDPDLAIAPENALEVAACEFARLGCLPAADADDLRGVTRRVNGGYIGFESRKAWLARWKQALPDLPGDPDESEDNERAPRGAEEKPSLPAPPVDAGAGVVVATGAGGAAGLTEQLAPVVQQLEPLRHTLKWVEAALVGIALVGALATGYSILHRRVTGGAA
jgi:putative chitinase